VAKVTIQDALDYCLGNPDGFGVEQLLAKFPEYRDELEPMLALSANIVTLELPSVPLDRRAAMKQRLMGAASSAPATVPQRPVVQGWSPRPWWESLAALIRRPAFAGALGTLALVALLWWSAAGSLPDSPFYNLKLTSEDLLRNFENGTSGRIESYLNSAASRLGDIQEMQRRDRIAQARPAIDNYRSDITNSAALWEQTSGTERTTIAKKLYVSSAQGFVSFAALAPDLSGIADTVRANISDTIETLEELRADTGGTLVSLNVDVNALLLEADIEPSTVPTPLPRFASRTATPKVPAVAGSTQTAVAGGTGTAVVSAQQTALARVSTETSTPLPTSTVAARSTDTLTAQTAVPTFSPRPAFTAQPPTARPPTHTPRPSHVPPTRKPTNTRIVHLPTSIPIVQTPLLRTVAPTSTSVPTAQPTSTSVPTETPILLSTLVPLPTITIELPPAPTQAPNTPGPTDTPLLPLPTIAPFTPPALPTITLFLPSPTQQVTSTSLPQPTEESCVLDLENVSLSCGSGLCLNAAGIVHNDSASSVTANWTASLRVKIGLQGYITLSTQTGRRVFEPGDTTLQPLFCVPLPAGTTLIQFRLSVEYAGCSEQESSNAIQPCLLP
jgi:hypothetical protein